MTDKIVHQISFGENSTFGACLTDAPGEKIDIHLFEIMENQGNPNLSDNLPAGCLAALDQLTLGTALEDVQWHFTSSPFHADFTFEPLGAGGYRIMMSSMELGSESFLGLSSCQKAVNHPQGIEHSITGGHRYYGSEAGQIIIIPVPHHPSGFYYMSDDQADREFALADSARLMAHWTAQSLQEFNCNDLLELSALYNKNAQLMSGDDNPVAPLHSNLETSLAYLGRPAFTDAPEMPIATYSNATNVVDFVNGRHRTLNLINAGAPFVPVLLASGEDRNREFVEKFGWNNAPATKKDNVMQAVYTAPLFRNFDYN